MIPYLIALAKRYRNRFWNKINRKNENKKKTGVQLEMSRSNLIYNIISLINDGAIDFENLEEFSDELKETVRALIKKQFKVYEFLDWNLYRN